MRTPDFEKIAAVAATGTVLGYADPVLAQAACSQVALGWPDAFALASFAFAGTLALWIALR